MITFKKRRKPNPEQEWLRVMTAFYTDNEIVRELPNHLLELLTYGLGYLSEYLRVVGAKDQVVATIEHEFLKEFGQLSDSEAKEVRQKIDRSTTETNPLLIELIFLGVESYSEKDYTNFKIRGRKVLSLVCSE